MISTGKAAVDAAGPQARPKGKGGSSESWAKDFSRNRYIYIMMIPVILYYILFHYVPMGGLVIAFQDYTPMKGFLGSSFVGFKHFADYLTGPYAQRTIVNTVMINLYQLVLGFPAPIILALLLNEVKFKRYKAVNQTISYMPHFVSVVVVAGLIINFVKSDGIVTQLLGMTGTNLLAKPEYYRMVYTLSGIWKNVGWGSIIYLATLSNADPNLYEAAALDGAGRFKQLLHVTLPTLVPIITIQLIMRMGNMMSEGYEKTLLIYNPLIYEKADIISSYVYRRGLENMEYSFASAVGMFNSLVNLMLLWFANWFSKTFVKESLW
ncbi:MAG: sugar ABC transporter permease [Provencibacterium sp.]|jgi:putative aldouronate transport system permease protein|nr:sugar ABC transporter permease [Provencibacterium sp.]